jgi:hypothetical protein
MNLKDMLAKMSQLSEATEKTKTGVKHTAEPGGYGRKDDEDDEGNKVKSDAPKKGRGRPKKDADETGEVKKYDFSAFGVKHGKDVKLPAYDKKKTTKHSLKDWIETIDQNMLAEAGYTTAPMPGAVAVKDAAGKVVATAKNPQAAQAFEKGDITIGGGEPMAEGGDEYSAKRAAAGKDIGKPGKNFDKIVKSSGGGDKGKRIAGAILAKLRGLKEGDMPSHDGDMGAGLGAGRNQGTFESKKPDKNKNNIPDYAEDGKGKNDLKKKVKEDMDSESKTDKSKLPSMAHIKKMCKDGKSVAEICKMHPNCDQKELKQMVADCKKKMVKEGLSQNLQAARLSGKSHGLKGHSHCGKNYEDMEEARMYHEGYKEGLDECYGMGSVLETEMPATVPGMASQADHEMDEGNAFTNALNRTPTGGKFSIGGRTFTDRSSIEETGSMFESWDNELSNLLNEYTEIQEGMTVSISKGNQNQPDSVTVSAQDGEADQLLAAIKQAGLGLFGGDEARGMNGQQTAPDPMTVDVAGQEGEADIDVVDDHEGMMDLIRKVTGGAGQPNVVAIGGEEGSDDNGDYEDEQSSDEHDSEGHDHEDDEATCESCGGVHEGNCAPEGDKEMVDEVESEDQQEFEVSEDNAPDSGAAETTADENAEAAEDQALATVDAGQDKEEGEEDAVQESYANGDDDKFETDINFMTKVISGGLNKQKSTGQTTVPVVATQASRLGNPMQESTNLLHDWKSLAGIK